jgi:hypothetical protein
MRLGFHEVVPGKASGQRRMSRINALEVAITGPHCARRDASYSDTECFSNSG